MAKPEHPVLMAVIGAAHGIKGEVRVKTFTGDPLALADYPLQDADGRGFRIEAIRPAGNVVVVRFRGVSDRNAAEALTGTELFTDRSALPEPGEGEYYHDDLIGLSVLDSNGTSRGKVTAVQNFGGGDILEITFDGREDILIPFTNAAVPDVDVKGGRMTIDLVAAGLVDDAAGEGTTDGFDRDRRPRGPKDAGGNR